MEPIAFVILSYNSLGDAARLCKDILGLPDAEACRVILVDNASPDRRGEDEWLADSDPRIVRVQSPENRGYSCGNNLGIDQARALGIDRVVILNPDVHLLGNETLVKRINQVFCEQAFLAIGFTVKGVTPYFAGLQVGALLFPVIARILDRWKYRWLLRRNPVPSTFQVGRIYGCAFLIRAGTFRELGLFDESVFLYGEETIVSHVGHKHGLQIMQSSDLEVDHRPLGSFSGALSRRHYHWMTASMAYYLGHYRKWPTGLARLFAAASLGQTFLSYGIGAWIRRGPKKTVPTEPSRQDAAME